MSAKCGLKLIDLVPQKTHGGSMRYVLAKKKQAPEIYQKGLKE